jgi:hypothetical protein
MSASHELLFLLSGGQSEADWGIQSRYLPFSGETGSGKDGVRDS